MLERYGIVTRETVLAEGVPGGFSTLYAELGNLELLGTARRGYFVEGLGGAQFALPGAVERLRSLPEDEGSFLLLAATDPANPYGASLPWPKREGGRRPARAPGAHVLLRDGEPVVYVERGGRGILRLAELDGDELADAMRALAGAVAAGRLPKLGGREARRRAGDRLRPRGGAARRRLQPRRPRKLTASARAEIGRSGDNRCNGGHRGEPEPGRAAAQRAALLRPRAGGAGALLAGRGAARLPGRDPRLPRGRPLRRLLHRPLGQLPRHPRALRRAGDHPRHARPRRHLRRAGDARRRGPLGQRRSARSTASCWRCRPARCGRCSPATRRSP